MPPPLHDGAARDGASGPHRPGASRRPAGPIPGRPYNARVSADLSPHPYASLTPDTVLDAVESVGFRADGHQLALNSYENRVYQVGLEEDQGGPLGEARFLVAKFYRPGRWSDEEILEEHAFAAELAAREIPVVPALELGGTTLHHHAGLRFAV